MVYCGKASLGCQSCRTRRIKCDKIRPQCSQCIRVGKDCPGYRDELSLMFRDESSKVMQKAHAQWGVQDGAEASLAQPGFSSLAVISSTIPGSSSTSSSSSSSASPSSSSAPFTGHKPAPAPPSTALAAPSPAPYASQSSRNTSWSAAQWANRLSSPIDPSVEEQGVRFYVNRYLIGHPDEPKTAHELSRVDWLSSPTIQNIMTAVGLAGISNLKGDQGLMISARQRYGAALRQTGELIKTARTASPEVAMKAIIMLAMFELVTGSRRGIGVVQLHVMGGVALLRSWCPMPNVPFGGVRSLLQLCYSMFIPAHLARENLGLPFFECVQFCRSLLEPIDQPANDLGILVAEFVRLSAYVQNNDIIDGHPVATSTLQQMLHTDAALGKWEAGLGDKWLYRVETGDHLPLAAVFQGEYHIYYDMWVARMWAHYRWARILLNKLILDFADKYPWTSKPLVPDAERCLRLKIIQKHARDMLVSTPSHWRHPLLLYEKSLVPVEKDGGGGSGAAGLPALLFQIKAAACAPGVPTEYWNWTHDVMRCIWGDLGMLHARVMMDDMEAYQKGLDELMTRDERGQHTLFDD